MLQVMRLNDLQPIASLCMQGHFSQFKSPRALSQQLELLAADDALGRQLQDAELLKKK